MDHKLQAANRLRPPHQIPSKRRPVCSANSHKSLSVKAVARPAGKPVEKLTVTDLEKRLKHRPDGRTPAHLVHLDIGDFPSIPSTTTKELPQRPRAEKFHFRKWIHRTNNSDLALVSLQNDPNWKILKLYKRVDTFRAEKAAYARLDQCNVAATGAVLRCYGWSSVTPRSFSHCDAPTCSGHEAGDQRTGPRESNRNPTLPARTSAAGKKTTYSWDNPTEKQMRDFGVDFRPPSVYESWSWRMDNSQFGAQGHWLPSGDNIPDRRYALLLEYLPNAKRMDSVTVTRELALKALAGAHSVQQALVRHGDQVERNLLAAEDGRAVWIDFDRAQVLHEMTDDWLVRFKKDLIEVYNMLFYELDNESGR